MRHELDIYNNHSLLDLAISLDEQGHAFLTRQSSTCPSTGPGGGGGTSPSISPIFYGVLSPYWSPPDLPGPLELLDLATSQEVSPNHALLYSLTFPDRHCTHFSVNKLHFSVTADAGLFCFGNCWSQSFLSSNWRMEVLPLALLEPHETPPYDGHSSLFSV